LGLRAANRFGAHRVGRFFIPSTYSIFSVFPEVRLSQFATHSLDNPHFFIILISLNYRISLRARNSGVFVIRTERGRFEAMVRNWLKEVYQRALWSGAVVLATAAGARAQVPVAAPAPVAPANLQATVEAQQRQIDELKRMIQSGAVPTATGAVDPTSGKLDDSAVKHIIDDYMKEKEVKKQQDEAAAKMKLETDGYRIGSDLSVKTSFRDGLFLWMNTPNNDFTMHIGGWLQYDNVFWSQSPQLKAAQAPGLAPPKG
jgi:hypothetical protein